MCVCVCVCEVCEFVFHVKQIIFYKCLASSFAAINHYFIFIDVSCIVEVCETQWLWLSTTRAK